jgi:hypothetical protein
MLNAYYPKLEALNVKLIVTNVEKCEQSSILTFIQNTRSLYLNLFLESNRRKI